MKKFSTLLFVAAMFLCMNATAQMELYRIGLKTGGQVTNFSGDDAEKAELDAKVGILTGVFATFKSGDIGFQPEILVSNKGATFETSNHDFRLWYFDVPLVFKYYVHDKFNLQVGPQLGYLFYAEFDGDDVDDEFKNIDISLLGGLEYEAPQNFAIGFRYNLGLNEIGQETTTVNANGVSESKDATDFKNTAIQFYISLGI